MDFIIIILLCISIWCFYKYKDLQIKLQLFKIENLKMKTKIKYLENYKTDVSKTFKILDDELLLIKNNLQTPQQTPQPNRVSLLTPQILTSLMSQPTSTVQDIQNTQSNTSNSTDNIFNNIFNRFLTSSISNNDIEILREQNTTNLNTDTLNTNTLNTNTLNTNTLNTDTLNTDTDTLENTKEDINLQSIPSQYSKFLLDPN